MTGRLEGNNRANRLECRENGVGRFLLCSVRDGEGKRHRLIFAEGKGSVRGWDLLVEKLRALGIKEIHEKMALRNQVDSREVSPVRNSTSAEPGKPQSGVGNC